MYDRILFPLWKDPSSENLLKLAQIRTAIPKVMRPGSDQESLVIRDEGKKIVLPKETNNLMVDESG